MWSRRTGTITSIPTSTSFNSISKSYFKSTQIILTSPKTPNNTIKSTINLTKMSFISIKFYRFDNSLTILIKDNFSLSINTYTKIKDSLNFNSSCAIKSNILNDYKSKNAYKQTIVHYNNTNFDTVVY